MPITVTVIILLTSWLVESSCPPPEKIYPCTCFGFEMVCSNMHSHDDLIYPIQATVKKSVYLLRIYNSKLMYIPSGIFKDTNYREIYFTGTELTSFSDSDVAFSGLEHSLNGIFISNIQYVDRWDWSQLSNLLKLQRLVVSQSTMYSIDQAITMPLISSLSFTQARISFIYDKAFSALENMMTLVLQGNKINELKRSMFPKPCHLQYLDLSENQLQRLPEDLFVDMPRLLTLKLGKNKIASLSEREFSLPMKQVAWLFIEENPIRCDCRMSWIVSSRKPSIFRGHCRYPENLKGVPITNLTTSQLWCSNSKLSIKS
ncbi:Reticulon-4 receptor, partial [Stegodyphus mimosarum]